MGAVSRSIISRVSLLLLLVMLGLTFGASRASAVSLVDQSFLADTSDSGPFSDRFIGNSQIAAQTFTVGITGLLTRIDVQLYEDTCCTTQNSNDIVLDIRSLSGVAPVEDDTQAYGTVTIDMNSVSSSLPTTFNDFISVDVSSFGLMVTAGQHYAIVLSHLPGGRYRWAQDWNAYTGGQEGFRNSASGTFQMTGYDNGFRTWVDPNGSNEVPEPGTLLLLGLGLLGAGIRTRRSV